MNPFVAALVVSALGAPPAAGPTLREAATLWTGCSRGDADACYMLATLGTVRVPDAERAGATLDLEEGCTAGKADACYALAMHLDDDGGRPPDGKRAFELFGRSCRAGFVPACEREAMFYLVSVPSREPDAKARATQLLKAACAAGWVSACIDQVVFLGVPAASLGAELLAGCAQGRAFSCRLAEGLPGRPKALQTAEERLKGLCAGGLAMACNEAAELPK